ATLPTVTGQCSATVTAPTATDNCAGSVVGTTSDSLTYTTQGTFTVHWTYDDGHGNTSTQSQTVVVADTTPPTVNCPEEVIAHAAAGMSNSVVNFTVSFFDTCGLASSNCVPASGTTFDLGTTTVTCTAMDIAGNTGSCTFNVIVYPEPVEPHDLSIVRLKVPKVVNLRTSR